MGTRVSSGTEEPIPAACQDKECGINDVGAGLGAASITSDHLQGKCGEGRASRSSAVDIGVQAAVVFLPRPSRRVDLIHHTSVWALCYLAMKSGLSAEPGETPKSYQVWL